MTHQDWLYSWQKQPWEAGWVRRGGVNSTHLNTAETSPVIAPVQGSSPKYVSEFRSRKPRTKRPRGLFCQNGWDHRVWSGQALATAHGDQKRKWRRQLLYSRKDARLRLWMNNDITKQAGLMVEMSKMKINRDKYKRCSWWWWEAQRRKWRETE